MDFVAIDFETANEKRWSPCEVSLVKVRNGIVEASLTRLIKPHESVTFSQRNVQLHGITKADVAQAQEFDVVANELIEFVDGLPLVAHSASFDIGVLAQTAALYSMELPEITFFCTRVLSQRHSGLDLPNYKLVNVCDALRIQFEETHRAEADARACAEIAVTLAGLSSVTSLQELGDQLLARPGVLSRSGFTGVSSARARAFPSALGKGAALEFLASLSSEDMQYDDDFKGKEVIFTGTLSSLLRAEAQEKVLKAGGFTGNTITKKTSIVVVGVPYDAGLRPGGRLSGKTKQGA